jgi:hypothetical protein
MFHVEHVASEANRHLCNPLLIQTHPGSILGAGHRTPAKYF